MMNVSGNFKIEFCLHSLIKCQKICLYEQPTNEPLKKHVTVIKKREFFIIYLRDMKTRIQIWRLKCNHKLVF